MFILEKLSVKEGKTSGVSSGHSCLGDSYLVLETEGLAEGDPIPEDRRVENKPFDKIKEGDMVIVFRGFGNFLRCSPINKINEVKENEILFETRSSNYSLRVFKGDNEQ